MIPKTIHYCWFGKKPLPPLAKECIESWRKYCPDFEIVQWNEVNFDINCIVYVKQAYEAQKYAFVSDYARFFILYHHGGIYMDTDVELLKPLDNFLSNQMFAGFENDLAVAPGLIMGSRAKAELIKELMDSYRDRVFMNDDGTQNTQTVVKYTTDILVNHGLVQDGSMQNIGGMVVYPKEYFCPLDYRTNKLKMTHNTYSIHHFAGSWVTFSSKLKNRIIGALGPQITDTMLDIRRNLIRKI